MQKKLLEKTQNSLESIKTYLGYKQEQFDKDPARRDAAGRQKHEQPRILKSIGMFEKLSRFYLQQSMTKPGWEYKPTEENEQKKSAFEQKLHSAKADYTTKLASRQSKERNGGGAGDELPRGNGAAAEGVEAEQGGHRRNPLQKNR